MNRFQPPSFFLSLFWTFTALIHELAGVIITMMGGGRDWRGCWTGLGIIPDNVPFEFDLFFSLSLLTSCLFVLAFCLTIEIEKKPSSRNTIKWVHPPQLSAELKKLHKERFRNPVVWVLCVLNCSRTTLMMDVHDYMFIASTFNLLTYREYRSTNMLWNTPMC